MKKALAFIITTILLIGCTKNDDYSDVKIRLDNISAYNFKNITVNTSSGYVNFSDLSAGQKSDYKQFSIAYRYAFVELQIGSDTFTLMPEDYTGEAKLKSGNYTYQVNANNLHDRYSKLSIELVKD